MKPDFATFDFSPEILDLAKEITLKDLLDAPFSQAWIVSAISNASHFATDEYPIEKPDDKLLFSLFTIVRMMPRADRQKLYLQTTYLLKKNRLERDAQDARNKRHEP
jgi:hypothetical protein